MYADGGTFLPRHGAIIAFTDGSRIEWQDAEVESVLKGAAYTSQCSIRLDEEQIQQKDIASIKLHTHEHLLTSRQYQRAKDIINYVIGVDLIELKSDQVVS